MYYSTIYVVVSTYTVAVGDVMGLAVDACTGRGRCKMPVDALALATTAHCKLLPSGGGATLLRLGFTTAGDATDSRLTTDL